MTLRELILTRLADLGWSQADLSRATGIPRQNLSPILAGKRPLLASHLLTIDAVLKLDLDLGAGDWPDGNGQSR